MASLKNSVKTPKIDLTANKTSAPVNKLISRINRTFIEFLKKSNVPTFIALTKTISIESYFLDHDTYKQLFGDITIQLFDQIATTAINSIIAEDVTSAINKAGYFVGLWDIHTIYDIVNAATTIMVGDEDGRLYFTAQQYHSITKEDLAKLQVGTYMPFDEYNPNRLYEQIQHIIGLTAYTVNDIIKNRWPKAYFCTEKIPMFDRIYNDFGTFMKDDVMKDIMSDTIYTERLIRQLTDSFDKPFMSYVSALLTESGLCEGIVLNMLSSVKLHVLYQEPEDHKMGSVILDMMFVAEKVEGKPSINFSITVGDLFTCINHANNPDIKVSKTKVEKFGRNVKKYLNDLCMFSVKLYLEAMVEASKKS